jgi:hypothetical protein
MRVPSFSPNFRRILAGMNGFPFPSVEGAIQVCAYSFTSAGSSVKCPRPPRRETPAVPSRHRPVFDGQAGDARHAFLAFFVFLRPVQQLGPHDRTHGNFSRGRLPQARLHGRADTFQVVNPRVDMKITRLP